MEEENDGIIDTLVDDEGNDSEENEDISTDEDIAKYKQLADNMRIRAEKAEAKLKGTKKEAKAPDFDPEEFRKQTTATVREELENQYLEDSEYPDDIKEEIKKVAKLNNISIKQAEKDSYVQYKIEQAVQEERFDKASVRGTKKTTVEGKSEGFLDPSKYDLNTEEGRTAWKAAKAKRQQ